LNYALPLIGVVLLIEFLHMSVIGTQTFFMGTIRTPMMLGVIYVGYSLVALPIGLFLLALLINFLAPTFAAQRNLRQALKVAVYSMTPACVASVFSLLPALGTLLGLIGALYGLYLLYLGLVPVMRTPTERAVGYTATIVVVWIVLWIVLVVAGVVSGGLTHMVGLTAGVDARQAAQQQESATVGNAIGSLLGTDNQGKAQLGAAINNLAKAGAQMDSSSTPGTAATGSNAQPGAQSGASDSGDDARNAGAAVGGLLAALGGALNGGHRVDPVDYNTLKAMLPDSLPNMQRANAEGSSNQALGMKGTSAKGSYTGSNDARVEIEIADVSAISGLADIASALPQTSSASSDSGYEKDVTIAGYPAHEKYDGPSRHAELSFILAKRFTVDLTGEHVDMSALEADAGRIDLARLVGMKDAGAH
jgi:hypothetical protein